MLVESFLAGIAVHRETEVVLSWWTTLAVRWEVSRSLRPLIVRLDEKMLGRHNAGHAQFLPDCTEANVLCGHELL